MVIDELIVVENGENKSVEEAKDGLIDVISVKENKNLFNVNEAKDGTIMGSTGVHTSAGITNRAISGFIHVKAGDYVWSINNDIYSGNTHKYLEPDESTWIGSIYPTITTTGDYSVGNLSIDVDCYIRTVFLPISSSPITNFNVDMLKTCEAMLEKGSQATEYVPYGDYIKDYNFAREKEPKGLSKVTCANAVPERIIDMQIMGDSLQNGVPTPETPIEIESVGERTKNLVNIPIIDSTISDNNKIDCYLTKPFIISCQEFPSSIKNASGVETSIWRFQIEYLDGSLKHAMDDGLKRINNAVVPKFNASEENPVISITYRGTYIREGRYSGIQIEYGDTITEYEPYGYKVPIRVSGKNLLNKETSEENYFINSSGVKTSTEAYGLKVTEKIYVKPSITYTYSSMGDVQGTTVGRTGYQYDKDNNPIIAISKSHGENVVFTTEANCHYVVLQYIKTQENPMLEENTIATDYEPYIEPTTTNIYLNEPLRKVNEYVDYIDYKNKKVVRNVKEYSFKGTEIIVENGTNNIDKKRMAVYVPNGLTDILSSVRCAISNCYPLGSADMTYTCKQSVALSRLGTYLFIYDEIHQTVDSFKSFLTEQYNSGNPVIAVYPITPMEEIIDIPEISTQRGTNYFKFDTKVSPSSANINYWKQMGTDVVSSEEIIQDNSNLLIIETGASLTQSNTTLIIGE